jgi:hypothetical protein
LPRSSRRRSRRRSWWARDVGGATYEFTQSCRDADIRFSFGYELIETVREALLELPEAAWEAALDAEGEQPRRRLGGGAHGAR